MSDSPKRVRTEYVSRLVGFANELCRECRGTGRLAWQDSTNGVVIPCNCVVYCDITFLREASEQGRIDFEDIREDGNEQSGRDGGSGKGTEASEEGQAAGSPR